MTAKTKKKTKKKHYNVNIIKLNSQIYYILTCLFTKDCSGLVNAKTHLYHMLNLNFI